jgi:Leucine-rich repeat (LRR) protein
MALLKPFSRLSNLNLNNTEITDSALPELEEFGRLEWLDLKGTKISLEGIERLRKAMPNTTISY